MRVDYIYDKIEKLGQLPYKCILFDGPWGIGKTYAIEKALEKTENVCKISLFGLQNSQQIYHEVLFQLIFRNNKAGKVAEVASEIAEKAGNIFKKLSVGKDAFQSIAKERELFLLLSKSFTSQHVIVIDDLERISEGTRLEEVLGIIEELKQCNYVKVILVANTKELKEADKKILDRYSEKVIENIYYISEKSSNIQWSTLGIHAGFIQKFVGEHNVNNLRTLQKAQRFYEDVSIYSEDISDQQFEDEIRWICFAIVVESTDNLYFIQNRNDKEEPIYPFENEQNSLDYRIMKYLSNITCSRNLVNTLIMYYRNEIVLTSEYLGVEHKLFLQAGNKPNYFKTDKEIKNVLLAIERNMGQVQNIDELNTYMDEYIEWCEILEEDSEDVLKKYKERVHELLLNEIKNGNESILSASNSLIRIMSESIKEIFEEERVIARKVLIKKYVEHLQDTTKGKEAYVYSHKLREYCELDYYKEIIKEYIKKLYTSKSFPVDEITKEQYYTCYNIMSVLYRLDKEHLLDYTEKLAKSCDKMSKYRMKDIIKKLEDMNNTYKSFATEQ